MRQMLNDALDAGFLGLSTLRSSFSKLEGTRYPARQLPSTYAKWSEFGALNTVLRKRGRVHQSTPNLARQAEVGRYLAHSIGRGFRRPLKTTLIAAADIKADRKAARLTMLAADLTNRAGGDFRWQHLPVPFEMYADGVDLVVFEEFGSGSAALNFRDEMSRGRAARRRIVPAAVPQGHDDSNSARGSGPAISPTPKSSPALTLRSSDKSFADVAAARGGLNPPTRCSTSPSSTAPDCAGAPSSPTTARMPGPNAARRPTSRSAFPIPAHTCATWRSTTPGFACSSEFTIARSSARRDRGAPADRRARRLVRPRRRLPVGG